MRRLRDSESAGLPPINVSRNQGKLLQLLARLVGARRILEIGTLGGYSTIWLARALPAGGRLITLEAEPKHAEVARANIARAGLAGAVEVRLGRAIETLPQLVAEGQGPFDFIFIDADKPGYADYLGWALKLSRRGTVIIADNIVRKGAVIDSASSDAKVQGVRRFNEVARCRAARERYGDSDRRRQRIRRVCDRPGHLRAIVLGLVARTGGPLT